MRRAISGCIFSVSSVNDSAQERAASDVLLDGRNYLPDDVPVGELPGSRHEEEFITVAKVR